MSPRLASMPWQCGGVASTMWRAATTAALLGRNWPSPQRTSLLHVSSDQPKVGAWQCSHNVPNETSHCHGHRIGRLISRCSDALFESHVPIVYKSPVNLPCHIESSLQGSRSPHSAELSTQSTFIFCELDAASDLPGHRQSKKTMRAGTRVTRPYVPQELSQVSNESFSRLPRNEWLLRSISQIRATTTSVRQCSLSHQLAPFTITGFLHASSLSGSSLCAITTPTHHSSCHKCWVSSSTPGHQPSRALSTSASSRQSGGGSRSAGLNVFDRHTKLLQRERSAGREDVHLFDYLKDEVGFRLADRIYDIKNEFKVGLDLGCGRGHLSKNLTDASMQQLFMSDYSPSLLASASAPSSPGLIVERRHVDEEQPLPFEDASLDLVISNLSLHWVNNLPGCLREVHRSLREDGTLLASMFGGDTLFQLRSALLLAEMERQGGVSAHVSPFTEVQDIGALLTLAGFEMLTIDTEDITVGYPSLWELMWDLQGMAESNASVSRCLHLPRDTIMAAAAIYQELYGQDEGVPATFQIIYMIGWKPNPKNVARPAARGSGKVSLKDIGRLEELARQRGLQGKMQFMEELDKGDRGPEGQKGDGQDK